MQVSELQRELALYPEYMEVHISIFFGSGSYDRPIETVIDSSEFDEHSPPRVLLCDKIGDDE